MARIEETDEKAEKEHQPPFAQYLLSKGIFLAIIVISFIGGRLKALPYVAAFIIILWGYWSLKNPEIVNPDKRIRVSAGWLWIMGQYGGRP